MTVSSEQPYLIDVPTLCTNLFVGLPVGGALSWSSRQAAAIRRQCIAGSVEHSQQALELCQGQSRWHLNACGSCGLRRAIAKRDSVPQSEGREILEPDT